MRREGLRCGQILIAMAVLRGCAAPRRPEALARRRRISTPSSTGWSAPIPISFRGTTATWLLLKDGRKFPISDGRSDKGFDEMIEHADIDDMFFSDYPAGADASAPAVNFDPGRVRYEPLFNAMYGDCKKGEVTPKMRAIAWLPKHDGGHVMITTANGVDKALEAVSRELDELPRAVHEISRPQFRHL